MFPLLTNGYNNNYEKSFDDLKNNFYSIQIKETIFILKLIAKFVSVMS